MAQRVAQGGNALDGVEYAREAPMNHLPNLCLTKSERAYKWRDRKTPQGARGADQLVVMVDGWRSMCVFLFFSGKSQSKKTHLRIFEDSQYN